MKAIKLKAQVKIASSVIHEVREKNFILWPISVPKFDDRTLHIQTGHIGWAIKQTKKIYL
jgi:hypothetical protein